VVIEGNVDQEMEVSLRNIMSIKLYKLTISKMEVGARSITFFKLIIWKEMSDWCTTVVYHSRKWNGYHVKPMWWNLPPLNNLNPPHTSKTLHNNYTTVVQESFFMKKIRRKRRRSSY
jgi:hypothetical protein